jgi:hypothetical protein
MLAIVSDENLCSKPGGPGLLCYLLTKEDPAKKRSVKKLNVYFSLPIPDSAIIRVSGSVLVPVALSVVYVALSTNFSDPVFWIFIESVAAESVFRAIILVSVLCAKKHDTNDYVSGSCSSSSLLGTKSKVSNKIYRRAPAFRSFSVVTSRNQTFSRNSVAGCVNVSSSKCA